VRARSLPLLLTLSALALLWLVACSTGPSSPSPTAVPSAPAAAFPRTVSDSKGASLTLAAPAKRIVSLSPAVTEVLFAIGAGPQIVASDRFSDFPAEAAKTAKLDYSQPSAEATVALSPDLVIMTTRQQQQVEQFRALRLPVLYMEEPTSLDATIEKVRFYGGITGHAAEADALANVMRARIARVTAQVPSGDGPRVFYELSPELYSAAPNSFIGSMLTLLHARNVADGAKTAFPQLSSEAVIAANPQVVLLADAGSTAGSQSLATVSARAGWSGIEAVRTGRVIAVDPNLGNRPGPRVVEGFEQMARALYPERFGAPTSAVTGTSR
jgi:iron complex transport system substrate-binding protein